MPETAAAPSAAPTRKLTTMLIGIPTLTALFGPAVTEAWPLIAPVWATGPNMTALAAALPAVIISGVIAYLVPDAPNTPT